MGREDGRNSCMDPMKVLKMVKSMGGQFQKILLVGCEPATFGPEGGQMGLSAPVEAAVSQAVSVVESLVEKACHGRGAGSLRLVE